MDDDTMETSVSCLAVVEKKPQRRHGGCVGSFFQLFDWNRRFAKKKLFSKKLLPPDRMKQSSKKFGGDQKQPKIRLIADENKGGFPNVKNNNGASKSDLDQKPEMRVPGLVARLMGLETMPTLHRDKLKKVPSPSFGSRKVENFVEKEGTKPESRPPKLQKTGVSERQVITRFGSEKLPPFKNVLARTRKHHQHPKLPTPVKSPRSGTRKMSSSRLIGAATRILEPGLQTSRSKNALTYANVLDHSTRMETFPTQSNSCDGLCRNCGNLLKNSDSKPIESEPSAVFASPLSCQGSGITKPGHSYYRELEDQSCDGYLDNVPPHVTFTSCKNPVSELGDPFSSNRKVHSENARSRAPSRRDNGKFEVEKRITVPPGRKRRPANIVKSTVDDRNYGFPQPMLGKQPAHNVHLINRQRSRNTGSDAVSIAYNSPVKPKSDVFERRVKNDATNEHGRRKKLEKPFPLSSGDVLGALLEQKLKEQSLHGEDIIGGGKPKKTTTMILRELELMSAFTSETPFQQNDNLRNSSYYHSRLPGSVSKVAARMNVDQQFDSEHLSPGSVLEAYFSTESRPSSSSVDDCHGTKMLTESIECSDDGQRSPNSEPLCYIKLANCGLNGSDLERAKDALTNAELAFHSTSGQPFPIKYLLDNELDALTSVLWKNFGCSLGIVDLKEANQMTRFAFDSAIECLGPIVKGCPKTSRKLPHWTNGNMLIFEIVEVVRKWEGMSRLSVDELVETEMSGSRREWTECESEVMETGLEISRCLYLGLLDEIVIDLLTGLM